MFKLVLISTLIVAACCMPADKDKSEQLEQSETQWNAAWANPAAVNPAVNPAAAAWGGNTWNRWNNPAAVDPRVNRWGAEPWNRQWGGANTATGWNQWNRAGVGAWPGAAAPAAAAVARPWNTW